MDVFSTTEPVDPRLETLGTILLTLAAWYYGYQLLFTYQPYIPLDYINLVTHETGGVFFIFVSQFYFMIGQNIYQSLVPLTFLVYFYWYKQPLGTGFCLFWLGDSILQTGLYMQDAVAMALPIVTIWGDGTGNDHDWNYVFSQAGLLPYAQTIGGFVWYIGALCIVASIAYLCYLSIKRFYPNFRIPLRTQLG